MINTESTNTMQNNNAGMAYKKMLRSAAVILLLTAIFGSLSFGFIQLNAAVMQLSLPESLWCGLAMALAVGFYLIRRKIMPETE